jgi:alpha/beta superfamily hydrolase
VGVRILKDEQEKKPYVRPRNVNLAFRVSEEERQMIERRMEQTGMTNLRAYMVKQAIDGRVIHIQLDSVNEMVRLLSNATNNLNQIAKRVNGTGNFYASDLKDLQARYDELWTQAREILRRLSEV